jgi:hypothetical protein
MPYCKICNEWNCDEHEFFIGKTQWKKEFTGSSPPEIFVGRWNYPNVYTGVLAPEQVGDTEAHTSSEIWHSRKMQIPDIMRLRNSLIYGRTQSNIHKTHQFSHVFKEIAMTHKPVATHFQLKKPIQSHNENEPNVPLISRAAPIERVTLEQNAPVKPKIDYLVNDIDVKSSTAMQELYKANTSVSSITKLLSAGLLGKKSARKLVPTKWSITAVDSNLSKEKLKNIKGFQELNDIRVFHAQYLGNHYEFLLLPGTFSFEVIEISIASGGVWQDYESQFDRKTYADSVTGAYYANRLALAEYLETIQRQAQCLVMREVRPEYYAPCGVGILRETSREAFKSHETFGTKEEAFQAIQSRIKLPISAFLSKSKLLKVHGKQKKLHEFF